MTQYLIYKTGYKKNDETYDFQEMKTTRSLERDIYNDIITLNDAFKEQSN